MADVAGAMIIILQYLLCFLLDLFLHVDFLLLVIVLCCFTEVVLVNSEDMAKDTPQKQREPYPHNVLFLRSKRRNCQQSQVRRQQLYHFASESIANSFEGIVEVSITSYIVTLVDSVVDGGSYNR